jgi:hypothetical protein
MIGIVRKQLSARILEDFLQEGSDDETTLLVDTFAQLTVPPLTCENFHFPK